MIVYTHSSNENQILQMLDLQARNLPSNISKEEAVKQGFVTVKHDAQLLWEMNEVKPHVIAMDGDKVIGYALVMTNDFKERIPVLVPMFEMIDQLNYEHQPISNYQYFVMGQVCIDKAYRGKGVFKGMYQQMKRQYQSNFDFVITEIANRNKRSLRAHEKIGFKRLFQYETIEEDWILVIWDWND